MTWDTLPAAKATQPTGRSQRCPTCGRVRWEPAQPDCECGCGYAVHADTGRKPCSRAACGCTHYRPATGN